MTYNNSLSRYRYCVILVVLMLQSFTYLKGQRTGVEILWDTNGIPHISSKNLPGMYYGYGWAQMHNHANLILRLYGEARGRAAEYWGADFLDLDKKIRLFEIPELGRSEYVKQKPEFRSYLDAFVQGINDYGNANPTSIDSAFRQVLPITSADVLSHCIRVLYLEFLAAQEIGATASLSAPGSNAVAVGPRRTGSENTLLLSNPHLPWIDLFTFFEAQLHSMDFNAYGVSLVGFPVLNIAFNQHLGWTHTVNTIDAADRYKLQLKRGGYKLDGIVVPFRTKTIKIKVRDSVGINEINFETKYARQGPVLLETDKNAYAIRIAGISNENILYQFHRMAAASTWPQFEDALKMMQLPMFNVIYADDKSNIVYLFNGNVPNRKLGDWKFWSGTIDGSQSKFIWNGILSYEKLPKLVNPSTGFLQNTNDPPWTCTYPMLLLPEHYSALFSPMEASFRSQRAIQMLKDDSLITFEKLVNDKFNTGMEVAHRFLDELLNAATSSTDSIIQQAVITLRNWDRCAETSSQGAVLFVRWYDKFDETMMRQLWDSKNPLETPKGLKNPKVAVELLGVAAREVLKDYDSLNVSWGSVYRFHISHFDYPANGGPERFGVFRTIYYVPTGKKYQAVAGDSYVAVTEFGKHIRAEVLLSYGNSSQPGNRHVGDQIPLLSQKRLRPALLNRGDILKNLEEREDLIYSIRSIRK